MLDYALLHALAQVVSQGSFERAAARLGITPSAVSQRVRLLEERTGTVLVVRGQPCRATPAGQRLCRHAAEVALLESGLSQDFASLLPPSAAAPTIPIAVNADSLAAWFLPALSQVPDRLFDLVLDDEDHTADWLRRGEVMAAVSTSAAPITGCSSRALGALTYRATASPEFVARWFAQGFTAQAFTEAPSLLFNRKDRLQERWLAARFGQAPPCPVHRVPSTHGFVDAALAGIGWGMNPQSLVEDHLREGRLVALDESELVVPLFWHWSRAVEPALCSLTQAVTAQARRALSNAPG